MARRKLVWTSVEGGKYRIRARAASIWELLQRKHARSGLSTLYRAAARSADGARYRKFEVTLSGLSRCDACHCHGGNAGLDG